MSGLYQKALHYIEAQRQLRIVKPEEYAEEEGLDVSPDDREKILSQINEIVDKNRIVIKHDTFDFRPKKKGGVLPSLLNLAALIIIAGGAYWLFNYFDRSEASIVTSRAGIQSAEGKLLAALKEESEQRLSEKEKAIADIEQRLKQMNSERERLEANVAAQIREREIELEASMMRELEAERQRLRSEGMSETDIEGRLRSFEAAQQAQFEERLNAVRAEAQKEIEDQRETLNRFAAEYREALDTAESEKSALQAEMTEQEATLLAQFQEKEAVLESERMDALQRLASIRAGQEREQLVLDQILSFYGAVQSRLSAGDLDGALAGLNELEAYLNQSEVISLEAVGKRRQVELFLIGSLKSLIAEQRKAASPDTQSLISSAQMLAAAAGLIEQGNERYLNADYTRAKELYIAALTGIPAVSTGYRRLREIEEDEANEQSARIGAITERADAAYLSGDYRQAVTLYGEALDLMSPLAGAGERVAGQITRAGFELYRQEDLFEIGNLQERVERQAAELEMLTVLRAELEAELAALRSRAASDAGLIAGIPKLENQIERIPVLQGEIDDLRSRLQASTRATGEQQARIEFLNAEIERLTTKALENARELLALNAIKSDAENDRQIRRARAEELSRLKESYLSAGTTDPQTADPLSVLELLEAKLVLRKIVSSEPVRSQYPDLYDNLELYIESVAAERQVQARLTALTTLNRLLDTLLSEEGSTAVDRQAGFEGAGERAEFVRLIERLTALLE